MANLPELHGRALGNQYALHALQERRAEMAGEIVELERRVRFLRDSLGHIDGTLRVLSPDFDPTSIKAKKPYKRVKLFGQGKLNAMILDALRRADRPLKTGEVVSAVAVAMKFRPEAEAGLKSRVRSNLLYLAKVRQTVQKTGDRDTARWHLPGAFDESHAPKATG